MLENRILISTHIEKASGTSIQNLYETVVGRDQIAIYNARKDTLRRGTEYPFTQASRVIDWFKSTIMDSPFYGHAKDLALWLGSRKDQLGSLKIPDDVMIIHGHFLADRFDKQLEDPLRSIVFREPLDRMRSQYDHWKRAKGHTEWRVNLPYDPDMTFEEYSLSPKLQNYQTQAVASKLPTDFHVVGVTDDLAPYENALLQLFIKQGWCANSILGKISVQKLNKTPNRKKTDSFNLNNTFIHEFRQFHASDYQLYREARRIAGLPEI